MSDDDDFEYDDDEHFDGNELEDLFYSAEDLKISDPAKSKKQFIQLIEDNKSGDSIFVLKSMSAVVYLTAKLGDQTECLKRFQDLIVFSEKVTRNEAQEAVETALDSLSRVLSQNEAQGIFISIVEFLKVKNSRLWFPMTMRLTRNLEISSANLKFMENLAIDLWTFCFSRDFAVDSSRVLEVLALKLRIATDNWTRRRLLKMAASYSSAVVDPRNIALMKEMHGIFNLESGKFFSAFYDFLEAMKNYQVIANSEQVKSVYKKLLVSFFLFQSESKPSHLGSNLSGTSPIPKPSGTAQMVDPFDLVEAQSLVKDEEFGDWLNLKSGHQSRNFKSIMNCLDRLSVTNPGDKKFLALLKSNLTEQFMQSEIVEVSSLKVIGEKLGIEDVSSIVVKLVNEDKIKGSIEFTNFKQTKEKRFQDTIDLCTQWSHSLTKLIS